MTAQIPDTFIYNGDAYQLIGIQGHGLITPMQFGMVPEMIHTACYRGFYATYELIENTLYLQKLTLREKNGRYLPIDGIEPEVKNYQATYNNLDMNVPFTGQIRLARNFIDELYIHMGFQKPTAFKNVLDISLKKGKVVGTVDRSLEMGKKRGAFKKHYYSGNMMKTIMEAFSLDMDLE